MTAGREVEGRPLDPILTDQDQGTAAVSWEEQSADIDLLKTKKGIVGKWPCTHGVDDSGYRRSAAGGRSVRSPSRCCSRTQRVTWSLNQDNCTGFYVTGGCFSTSSPGRSLPACH